MPSPLPPLPSDTILAPMAGVTDVAFRLLCKKDGAGLTVTEMRSAHALARANKAVMRLIDVVPEEAPRCIQLFGQKPEYFVQSAKFLENKGEIIDLNFGCPASQIIQQGAGSALLERPNQIQKIVAAVSSAVNLPVTCKLRLGINSHKINVVKIAQLCEQSGAAMITVHARTQKQGYTGKADWSWIKKVKEAVKIPICGNGDVRTPEDYLRMKTETSCDLVMIGRGAIGNPFLFNQIEEYKKTGKYTPRTQTQQLQDFFAYLKLAEKYNVDFNYIKFHALSFTKGIAGSAQLREKLSRMKTVEEIKKEMEVLTKTIN
ncbi:tRNA dihydrouridine synthase DusB [Candidatus Woesearchaeota archaeon]|nr:tRNA dihydrouridine synthase DusB [Candidatus Woesearchaeota archaeon]